MSIRIAAIGLTHSHIYGQVDCLLREGATLVGFWSDEEDVAAPFSEKYPQAKRASDRRELLDDESIHMILTSAIPAKERPALTEQLEALIQPPGFTGNPPGGPSRWNTERTGQWEPLKPELVVEVRYDQVTGRRFRHGTALLRWRFDKAPKQCTFEQLAPELKPSEIAELFAA